MPVSTEPSHCSLPSRFKCPQSSFPTNILEWLSGMPVSRCGQEQVPHLSGISVMMSVVLILTVGHICPFRSLFFNEKVSSHGPEAPATALPVRELLQGWDSALISWGLCFISWSEFPRERSLIPIITGRFWCQSRKQRCQSVPWPQIRRASSLCPCLAPGLCWGIENR